MARSASPSHLRWRMLTILMTLITATRVLAQNAGEHVTTSPIGANPSPLDPGFTTPADCDIAVGLFHAVVVDNYQFHVYDKSQFGYEQPSWLMEFPVRGDNRFFPAVPNAVHLVDPRVVYDFYDHRYWIVMLEVDTSQIPSLAYFNIAVTATSDPTGEWHKFRLDARAWGNGIIADLGQLDFDLVSVDDQWVYIAAWCHNIVVPFPAFERVESPVWIIDKQELMDNLPAPYTTRFQRFLDSNQDYKAYNHRAVPSPALNVEATEEPQYFLGVDPGNPGSPTVFYPNNSEQLGLSTVFDEITVHAITWAGTTSQRHDYHLELPATYRIATNAHLKQPQSDRPLRLNSARFWSAPVMRDGHIWATHHVRQASTDVHEVRWYKIAVNGWPDPLQGLPTIVEWGVINAFSNGGGAIFPSIDVNFWGDMMIGYHEAGPNQVPQPRYFLRTFDGLVQDNQPTPFGCEGCTLGKYDPVGLPSPSVRWGDYSGTKADPTDWCTFWTYHMWAQDGDQNRWRTWLARISPSQLCALDAMVDLTRDRQVDFRDLQRFDEVYRDGKRAADFNRDRRVNIHDFAAYLDAYSRVP